LAVVLSIFFVLAMGRPWWIWYVKTPPTLWRKSLRTRRQERYY
jgi:hypothetical protein